MGFFFSALSLEQEKSECVKRAALSSCYIIYMGVCVEKLFKMLTSILKPIKPSTFQQHSGGLILVPWLWQKNLFENKKLNYRTINIYT